LIKHKIDYKNTNKIIIKVRMESVLVIIKSSEQTKNWRKEQDWYKGGKSNECELYQRDLIEKITKEKCIKNNLRLNLETNQIVEKKNVLHLENGFEFTEDFDGLQKINDKKYLYNLKFVCDAGGAQTRTLREVYHFIKGQLEHLINIETEIDTKENLYFVNIIDGDESNKHMKKFIYLLNLEKYKNIRKYIFVGDMYLFNEWFNDINKIKEIEININELNINKND
jgi:hypothetical protein